MNGEFPVEDILRRTLFADPNGDHSQQNLVDGLFAIAESLSGLTRALRALGNADACTPMGAIEAYSVVVREAGERIAGALQDVAAAIEYKP